MKTLVVKDDPLVHVIGALNADVMPNIAALRTWCGQWLYCAPHEVWDDYPATCVRCAMGPPDWVRYGKGVGAGSIKWQGSSALFYLTLL